MRKRAPSISSTVVAWPYHVTASSPGCCGGSAGTTGTVPTGLPRPWTRMAATKACVWARTRGRSDGSSPSNRRLVKFGESWTNGRIAAGEAPIRFITRTNCRARVREETFSMTRRDGTDGGAVGGSEAAHRAPFRGARGVLNLPCANWASSWC